MTIYFLQSNPTLNSGGLIQAYRHVRILADAGHDARLLFLDPEDKPALEAPYAIGPDGVRTPEHTDPADAIAK